MSHVPPFPTHLTLAGCFIAKSLRKRRGLLVHCTSMFLPPVELQGRQGDNQLVFPRLCRGLSQVFVVILRISSLVTFQKSAVWTALRLTLHSSFWCPLFWTASVLYRLWRPSHRVSALRPVAVIWGGVHCVASPAHPVQLPRAYLVQRWYELSRCVGGSGSPPGVSLCRTEWIGFGTRDEQGLGSEEGRKCFWSSPE